MSEIRNLYEKHLSGEDVVIYPITTTNAVFDSEGNTIDAIVQEAVSNTEKAKTSVQEIQVNGTTVAKSSTGIVNIDNVYTKSQVDSTFAKTTDIPTKVSSLTNDSGYITSSGSITGNAATATTATNSTNTYNAVTNPSSSTTYQVPFVTESTTSGQRQNKVNNGLRYTVTEGTTSADGVARLLLGNSTASGTAGNKRATIRAYGSSTYYTDILSRGDLAASNTVYFPRSNGYIPVFDSGSITSGTLNGGDNTTSFDVTFNRAFKVAPQVMVTPVANTKYHDRVIFVTALTVTTTGFTVSVVMNGYASDQDLTTTRRIDWLAVGI